MTNLGTIKTLKELNQDLVAQPGDIVYCEEDNKVYIYYDEGLGKPFGWKEYEINKNAMINLGMTEYEINKMIIAQLPSLISTAQLKDGKELIKAYTHTHKNDTGYYMLLCNDIHYYTVFRVNMRYEENIEDIVIECLQNIGVIQQINKAENENAIECWIKNDKGVFMFMLFNYDWGVITCQ